MDVFDLGVGLASREGGGGSGAGDFSLRTDFRESGVGGGTSFGGEVIFRRQVHLYIAFLIILFSTLAMVM